jgi:hypothetical protein
VNKTTAVSPMQCGTRLFYRYPLTFSLASYQPRNDTIHLSLKILTISAEQRRYQARKHGSPSSGSPLTPPPSKPQWKHVTWRFWLQNSNGKGGASYLEEMRNKILNMLDSGTDVGHIDKEKQTLLHTFISLINPRTMPACDVQRTLRMILNRCGCSLHNRNARGETPFQLAGRLALPHVLMMLLWHVVDSHGILPGSSNNDRIIKILQGYIDVENDKGVTLITDVHLTHWRARHSKEPDAFHFEIDALMCTVIIANAMDGQLLEKEYRFRELREDMRFATEEDKKRGAIGAGQQRCDE